MKVLIDFNILLDVIQRREPHYGASARLLSLVAEGAIEGVVPGHAVTTVHYIVGRFAGRAAGDEAVDWLLGDFKVVGSSSTVMLRARGLGIDDFEDAVVAATAEEARCRWIVTRNVTDFAPSPVPAITPGELLAHLDAS